ncbi:hypothetical protein WMY93_013831 [Mugilogobius chulae]|uniref:Tetraspanin n=1 Tax=Mugilogobius chulae TaxID=88201 RepID=A0AAW0PA62_9GOBI
MNPLPRWAGLSSQHPFSLPKNKQHNSQNNSIEISSKAAGKLSGTRKRKQRPWISLRRRKMGTVHACVKRGFITVASLIAILSGLLLAVTLFSHGYFHEDEEIEKVLPGLQVMYATSIITILLVTTGLYGICKRKKWMLISVSIKICLSSTLLGLFLTSLHLFQYIVGMTLCSMLLGVLNIQGLAVRPKLVEDIKVHYSGVLPYSNASKEDIDGINELQTDLQCCGMYQGYQEWGYNISEACLCVEGAEHPCVAAPRNSSLFENTKTDDPIMIYKEPCITYLAAHAMFALDILLGIILGTILLWVSSVVLCIVTLCQMNRKEDTPAVVYSHEAKAGNYSVLLDELT